SRCHRHLPARTPARPWPACPRVLRAGCDSGSDVVRHFGSDHSDHSRMVLSLPPETTCLPSGLKATPVTQPVWSVKHHASRPFWMSHSRTVPSKLPDPASRPSGERATLETKPL